MTDATYQRLMINILDRVVDFYIILYSSFIDEKASLELLKEIEQAYSLQKDHLHLYL